MSRSASLLATLMGVGLMAAAIAQETPEPVDPLDIALGRVPVPERQPESEPEPEPEDTADLATSTRPDSQLSLESEEIDENEEPEPETWVRYETATLRGLDKITGRSTDFDVQIGTRVVFGSLDVDLQVCFQKPPEEPPESAAFMQVTSTQPMGPSDASAALPLLFSGWMFASSPGLNALEHPVYDVWVIACSMDVETSEPLE